jgi:hypothetical protein
MTRRPPACGALVYVSATAPPSAASRLAIAAPMPRDPPVTSATLPVSFFDTMLVLSLSHRDRFRSVRVGSITSLTIEPVQICAAPPSTNSSIPVM